MKSNKTLLFLTLVFLTSFLSSQEKESVESIKNEIKELNQSLNNKNEELSKAISFLDELKASDPNNALITTKQKDLEKIKLEVINIKASIFERNEALKTLENKSDENEFSTNTLLNANIISKDSEDNEKLYWYENDIRNPISFTQFIIRNPRTNGKDKLTRPSNLSSYHYIKPGSLINIIFNKEVYNQLNNAQLTVSAYLKRVDGTIVPVTVSGYFEVEVNSNQVDFEKNIALTDAEDSLVYNFEINSKKGGPIQAEVNTSMINPQPKDKLIITITNVSDGNTSFTTTFEYEDFGWETTASGGFSWVNTINQNNSNFKPAGSSGVSFHYKLDKGSKFWLNFINPSFGPELLVLQDANQNTNVGLGLSISTALRTVKFGYGWYLVGENGRPYVSIGVNFVEGFKTISSILSRSKE